MTKFNFEGLNISIDPNGKFVIDSIYDDKGNTVSLENVEYDKEGNVIVPDADEDTTINDN